MKNVVKKEMIHTIISYQKNVGMIMDTQVISAGGRVLRCDEDSVTDWNQSLLDNLYSKALVTKVNRNHRIEVCYCDHMYTIRIQRRYTQIDKDSISDLWNTTTLYGEGRSSEDAAISLLQNCICQTSKETVTTLQRKQKRKQFKVLS